jgi:hypothetical protein
MPVFSWGFVWRSSKRADWQNGDKGQINGDDIQAAARGVCDLHGLAWAGDLPVHHKDGVPFVQLELEHPDSDSPSALGLLQVTLATAALARSSGDAPPVG